MYPTFFFCFVFLFVCLPLCLVLFFEVVSYCVALAGLVLDM